jgi:hypothetical protein
VQSRARRWSSLLFAFAFVGCERAAPPAPVVETPPVAQREVTSVTALERAPAPAARVAEVGRPFRIERAAAASPTRVFAVSDQRLWHVVEGRWAELPVDGASVRDVTAVNGIVWVLARGGDDNLGHVTVLRSASGDDLTLAWDVVTAPTHEPRALAVASERDFYVGGENPTLLRARYAGSLQTSVTTLPSPVKSLLYMPDQMMAVTYADDSVGMFRWGEVNPVERPDYLFSFSGMRESLMVRRDGAVWRGRVWEQPLETDRLSSASGMVPIAAATLRDERVVEIDANHRSRILRDGRWADLETSDPPGEVVALFGARSLGEGQCVMVDREGGVFELVDSRWVRRVSPATGTLR